MGKLVITFSGSILIVLALSCIRKELPKGLSNADKSIPVSNSDCDNPDADINCCFLNMPGDLNSVIKIPDDDTNAEQMVISGRIYRKDGKTPYKDVILYAYHTDAKGEYSKKGNERGIQKWHGSHHGWCKTDQNGYYRIETIRPAPYPNGTTPAHIHAAIKLPDSPVPFYITDFMFKDDPYLPKVETNKFSYQGGSGIIAIKKTANVWIGERNLILN